MTDAAAPAAAPAAPAAPNAAPANAPPSAAAQTPPAQQQVTPTERQRIALADAPDDADVVLRIDGRDVVLPASEARRRLQTHEAANQRFNAAKQMRAQAEAMARDVRSILEDPDRFRDEMIALGRSPGDVARAILEAEIAEANMTPEQKRLRQLEREHRQLLAERQRQEQMAQQQEVQNHAAVYSQAFSAAADAAGVPASPRIRQVVTQALVDTMQRVLTHNESIRDPRRHIALTAEDLAGVARKAYEEHANDYRAHLPREYIRAALTDEDIQWYHEQRRAKPRPTTPTAPQPNAQPDEYPRDRRGRFADPNRAANRDNNGRTIVQSGSFADMFEARRKSLGM